MAKVLWGSKTPGQANDQRDEVILANKKKVFFNILSLEYFSDSTTSFIGNVTLFERFMLYAAEILSKCFHA